MFQPAGFLFPDVELWATGYLRAALAGRAEPYAADVYVSNRVPTTRRARMVVVRRDGGRSNGNLDDARLAIRTWAATEQDATNLALLVHALIGDAPGSGGVLRTSVESGPSPVADESDQPLRLSVFTIRQRGVEA